MELFDASEYTRAPVFNVSGGITLARALVDAKPAKMAAHVEKAAAKLAAVANEAQEILVLRQRAAGEDDESTRAVDAGADNSWAVLQMRLESYARLPVDKFAKAARARELLDMIYGEEGLAFLRERYPVQLTMADTILKRIDEDGLQNDIDALAGPEFLQNIRVQHERYGTMVKGVLMRERAAEEDLRDHVRRLQRAIMNYALNICATVDDEDPATAERAHGILKPIINFRRSNPRTRYSSDIPEPSEPAPDDASGEQS